MGKDRSKIEEQAGRNEDALRCPSMDCLPIQLPIYMDNHATTRLDSRVVDVFGFAIDRLVDTVLKLRAMGNSSGN